MAATAPLRTRRARHDPRESEREILQAAEEILREVPYRNVTVEAIMRRTGLKRPAFYAHFRDRHDIVLRVVQDIGGEILGASAPWLEGGEDPRSAVREALLAAVAVYAAHGPILRAIADAAPGDDRVEGVYRGLLERITEVVARRIAADQRTGLTDRSLDPRETARALVLMSERYQYDLLGRGSGGGGAEVAGVLERVWIATLYGADAPRGRQRG